jgi:hypothetical protein
MSTPTLESAREALAAAEAAHAKVKTDAEAAGLAFDADIKALGTQPPAPTMPVKPTAPTAERPDPDALAAARTLAQEAPFARRDRSLYVANLATAERADADAQATLAAATTAAASVVAHLAAARQAPTDIAREQADLLSTPLVRFVFPIERTSKEPHVTAEYHHRQHGWIPFACASTGEQAEATVGVQAKIRELATTTAPAWAHVPIVVDVQDFNGGTGPYPDVPGFSIWHVSTAEGTPLTVAPGRPA